MARLRADRSHHAAYADIACDEPMTGFFGLASAILKAPLRFSALVRNRATDVDRTYLVSHPQSRQAAHSITAPSIWEYIEHKIAEVDKQASRSDVDVSFRVEASVLKTLLKVLYDVCDTSTVYPQIAPDGENGITAVWHAGKLMVEIVTDSDLSTWALIRDGDEVRSFSLDSDRTGYLEARRYLSHLSALVHDENPNWRELFVER